MPREKFQTLTEPMFYILLCLRKECCGMDIMAEIERITKQRLSVGPGTLYHLLEQFHEEGLITETRVEGRRRSYILTRKGRDMLDHEYRRLRTLVSDFESIWGKEG